MRVLLCHDIESAQKIKRETGVNPVRSRHCESEFAAILPLRKREGGSG